MLNWLVVGIGDITTRRVIPAIQAEPRSHLYGVVTSNQEKGRAYADHVWTDLGQALWDNEIDVVYIGTPVFLHAPQTLMSLRSGKHVLCEKPMAMNLAEAQEMVNAAKIAGRTFGVAYYRRLYPKVLRARQLLDAGVIGNPVLAEISFHDQVPARPGFREWLIDPAKAGGGPLYDVGSHRIDLLNYFFRQPLAVCAHLSNIVHDTQVEDSATCIIEYQTGVRGIVDVRWHANVVRDEFRITGTDGEINLTPLNSPRLVYPGGEDHLPVHDNVHYPLIENFADAVLNGAPLVSSGETAIWTDWVTEQAMQTSAGG